jgi:hypothetical protein
MKSIRYKSTLVYYDGPQVVEARDPIGGHYIAVLVEPANGADRFLVAGVSPRRLREFRTGALDLRALLLDREIDEWYIGTPIGVQGKEIKLDLQSSSLTDSGLLPDAGFFLHHPDAPIDPLAEARASEPRRNVRGERSASETR